MADWLDTINHVYQILQITINAVKEIKKIRSIVHKDYIVTEIKERLQNGELHFGDQISAIGTFCEYVPFIDPKFILKKTIPSSNALTHTTRLQPIDDVYCGALFPPDQKDAFSKETLPIFYGIESPMLEHLTGDMLEMKCRLTQIPMMYREIIKENDFFTLEKEDKVNLSFGLEVLDVEPYGLVDTFKINTWVAGNLNPFPIYELDKRNCFTCANGFSFMKIDPVDFPPRIACASTEAFLDPVFTGRIKEATKEFSEIEKAGVPHVVFPDIFALFKIICPNIDIYNSKEMEYSHNLLMTALKQNLQKLFTYEAAFSGFKIPEEIKSNLDYQYDQRVPMTEQTFDPKKVPEWKCSRWEYNPEWEKKRSSEKKRNGKEEKSL